MVRPGLGVVTSPFGPRFHPILHYVKVHTGIDFAAADGIAYAADDGVVMFTEYNTAYGNMTVIDHGRVGGLHMTTLYAHQAAIGVKPATGRQGAGDRRDRFHRVRDRAAPALRGAHRRPADRPGAVPCEGQAADGAAYRHRVGAGATHPPERDLAAARSLSRCSRGKEKMHASAPHRPGDGCRRGSRPLPSLRGAPAEPRRTSASRCRP
jgi:hypothetical protein